MKLNKAVVVAFVLVSVLTLLLPFVAAKPARQQGTDKGKPFVEQVANDDECDEECNDESEEEECNDEIDEEHDQECDEETNDERSPIVEKVTGGGWIFYGCGENNKKTFGFNAQQLEDGSLKGKLQYVDHETKMKVHGYEVTNLMIDGKQAWIYGMCRLNGDNTPRMFVVWVIDEGEPGKHDYFSIWVDMNGNGADDPGVDYQVGAQLGFPDEAGGGGNIKIHVPAPP